MTRRTTPSLVVNIIKNQTKRNDTKRLLHHSYLVLRNDVLTEDSEDSADKLLSTSLRGTKQSLAENVSLVGSENFQFNNQ